MLLAASVQGLAQKRQSAPPTQPQPSESLPRIAYDERAWKPFESTEGRFSVAFPGKPGLKTEVVETSIGKLVNRIHGLEIGVALFAVSYTDFPPPLPTSDKEFINRLFEAGQAQVLAGTGDKLISETPLTLDGHPGRYYLSSSDTSLQHSQSYLVGNRLYQLNVISDDYRNSPAEDQKFFQDLVKRFFTSFKLTTKSY